MNALPVTMTMTMFLKDGYHIALVMESKIQHEFEMQLHSYWPLLLPLLLWLPLLLLLLLLLLVLKGHVEPRRDF